MGRTFKPLSVTLTERDKKKLDRLAKANRTNRSDLIRQMIRAKRLPRKTGKQNLQHRRETFLGGAL